MGEVKVGDKVFIKTLQQMRADIKRVGSIDPIWTSPISSDSGRRRYQAAMGSEVVITFVKPNPDSYEDYDAYRAKYHYEDIDDFILADCDIITTPMVSLGSIYGEV